MAWKNFSIWRGKLPHWRAEDVVYYVTFRHRRALNDPEKGLLLVSLLKLDGKYVDLLIACVLPEQTELIFTCRTDPSGEVYELSDAIEKAKVKTGRKIIKMTDERYPPFYGESFDRILRDEAELEEKWLAIFDSPVQYELVEDAENYPYLWVSGAPS